MSEKLQVLKAISWRDCCPWILLFRTFGLSFHIKLMLLALFGVLLTNLGTNIGSTLFLTDLEKEEVNIAAEISSRGDINSHSKNGTDKVKSIFQFDPMIQVWNRISNPFRFAFQLDNSLRKIAYFAFLGIWTTATWSIFGGAICRVAALDLSCGERLGFRGSLKYAGKNFFSYFIAPLFPFLGVFAFAIPIAILGLIASLGESGTLISAIFGFISIICAVIMACSLLPLMFGWPLMWGTISTEASDSFDAVSRTYAYVTQRPFHYLFYIVVSMLIGAFGLFVAMLISSLASYLLNWAFLWGAGQETFREISLASIAPNAQSGLMGISGSILMLWNSLLLKIMDAYAFSFFFVATAGIYLLLRRDIDQAELDEIVLDDGQSRFPPPPLKTDEAGIPAAPEEKTTPSESEETAPKEGESE